METHPSGQLLVSGGRALTIACRWGGPSTCQVTEYRCRLQKKATQTSDTVAAYVVGLSESLQGVGGKSFHHDAVSDRQVGLVARHDQRRRVRNQLEAFRSLVMAWGLARLQPVG